MGSLKHGLVATTLGQRKTDTCPATTNVAGPGWVQACSSSRWQTCPAVLADEVACDRGRSYLSLGGSVGIHDPKSH